MKKGLTSITTLFLLTATVFSTEAGVPSRQFSEDSFYNPKIGAQDMNRKNIVPSFEGLINTLSASLGKNVIITDCSEKPILNPPHLDKENSFQLIDNKVFMLVNGKTYQVSFVNSKSEQLNKEEQIKISNELVKYFELTSTIPATVVWSPTYNSLKSADPRTFFYQDVEKYSNLLELENKAVILDIYDNFIKYDSEEERVFEFDPFADTNKVTSKKDREKKESLRREQTQFLNNIIKKDTIIVTSENRRETSFVKMLSEMMPDKQFLIADRNNIQSAYNNILKQKPVVTLNNKGEKEANILVVPEYSSIKSEEIKKDIANSLNNLSFINKTEWDNFISGKDTKSNIILIIAEEERFEEKIREAGEKGLLKDKVVMLSVCRQRKAEIGQPDLIKTLLQEFGASGVITYGKEINPKDIPSMLEKMDSLIQNSEGERLFEFIQKSLDKNEKLKNPYHDVRIKKLNFFYFS